MSTASDKLRITILSSSEDIASTTIKIQLLGLYPFQLVADDKNTSNPHITSIHQLNLYDHPNVSFNLYSLDCRMIFLDNLLKSTDLEGDIIIFASRHRSESNQPGLLCHTPGNWKSDVSMGGNPQSVAVGSGLLLNYLYRGMKSRAEMQKFNFPIEQEVTHHGPTGFKIPMAFIELGSTEIEWRNPIGAKIIAETIIDTGIQLADKNFQNHSWHKQSMKICIGFGGTHYTPNFKRLIEKGCGFPHVIPKYAIMELNQDIINSLPTRILEPLDYWVVDWKGVNSAEKAHLLPLLEATHIPYIKTKELEDILSKQANP